MILSDSPVNTPSSVAISDFVMLVIFLLFSVIVPTTIFISSVAATFGTGAVFSDTYMYAVTDFFGTVFSTFQLIIVDFCPKHHPYSNTLNSVI